MGFTVLLGSFCDELIGEAENRPGLATEYAFDAVSGRVASAGSLTGGGERWIALTMRTGFRIAGGGGKDGWWRLDSKEGSETGGVAAGGSKCFDDKSFQDRLKKQDG